jgi:8-oxo-dGTP diphosphatase
MGKALANHGGVSASTGRKPEVRAAGGVIWREGDGGGADAPAGEKPDIEVVVIHRPRHDDWTFPKGKLNRGETYAQAAAREVEEETGLRCELDEQLPPVRYTDSKGREKIVRYWAMRVVGASAWSPNHEVDRRRWVSLDEARRLLSYPHDRELLTALVSRRG